MGREVSYSSRRQLGDRLFLMVGAVLIALSLGTLVALMTELIIDGAPRLNAGFITSHLSPAPQRAGILAAIIGTCAVMVVTACTALPLGIASGVYLEEYARKNWLTVIIEVNIANLAGVPSIIWGLMALGLLVYTFHLGRSILTAGLTLGLLVLPIVIVATRESIRAIPHGLREASFALGATRWQTVWHHVLPNSMSGILTGTIIAMSRAIGETAPLVTIGGAAYLSFLPPSPVINQPPYLSFQWLWSDFTVLPIQMYQWVSKPNPEFHANAAAAGVILIAITLSMNALAIGLRYRSRQRLRW